ncbi:uncharacterized protein TNCT_90631 [Trichonephila clavata]|uniref:Myb-like domain-containing protein n=1 Tax=Trichonephila clavata TaxID=2740835 RepID=A0A8X6J206_TRICU|nr:uncharacterized protein TNCT_90631 [Trichonephila clavata]
MSSNIFWTLEEDEVLIDFVRNHDVLYNIKHQDYRKTQIKQHLWENIGTTLEKSASDCCKRWGYVRDYYIRRRGKPGSCSSGIAAKKRSDLLSFLDRFASSQRPSTTNMESGSQQGFSDVTQLSHTESDSSTAPEIILEHQLNDDFRDNKEDKFESMSPKKRKKLTDSEEQLQLLKEIAQQKAASQNEPDEVDLFFGSMAKIFKRLPRKEQAELRIQITNLISNAELRSLKSDASPACSTPRNEEMMLSGKSANICKILTVCSALKEEED